MKYLFERPRPFYRKKKFMIPLMIILFFVILRLIAPPIILGQINKQLEELSPTMSTHVDDLDLQILNGGALLKGITAQVKKNDKKFLDVASVFGSVDFGELVRGEVVAKAVIDKADFTYSNDLMQALKDHLGSTKDENREKPNIRVARVDLKKSIVRLEPYSSITREQGVLMDDINARATNLIPTKEQPKTMFSMQGKLLHSGVIKVTGEALTESKPMIWSIDNEILDFDLTSLNQFLIKKVPLTFTKGHLDFFMEAKSEDNKVTGYLKPFVKDLDVVKTQEEFKNTKHWIFEVITAIGNIVMRSDKVAATRVPFMFDGQVKVETGESLSKAFEHGFVQELNRGIENSVEIK